MESLMHYNSFVCNKICIVYYRASFITYGCHRNYTNIRFIFFMNSFSDGRTLSDKNLVPKLSEIQMITSLLIN